MKANCLIYINIYFVHIQTLWCLNIVHLLSLWFLLDILSGDCRTLTLQCCEQHSATKIIRQPKANPIPVTDDQSIVCYTLSRFVLELKKIHIQLTFHWPFEKCLHTVTECLCSTVIILQCTSSYRVLMLSCILCIHVLAITDWDMHVYICTPEKHNGQCSAFLFISWLHFGHIEKMFQ